MKHSVKPLSLDRAIGAFLGTERCSRKWAALSSLAVALGAALNFWWWFVFIPGHHPSDLFRFHGLSIFSGNRCDLTRGKWIRDTRPPLYTNDTCKYIQPNQDCMGQGRPDTDFIHWKWKPHGCVLPPFDGKFFLEMMRGKKMLFVGDSIARNHMQSLLCSLAQVEDPQNLFNDGKDKEFIWVFYSYNFTLANSWSPFLANQTQRQGIYHIHLDMPDVTWTSVVKKYDVAIFSTAYWYFRPSVYYLNNETLGANDMAKLNMTTVRILPHMKMVWETVLKHVVDEYQGLAIMRTVTVPHFEGGQWNDGGVCNRTQPESDPDMQMELPWTSNEMYNNQKNEFMKALERKGYCATDLRLELLDVTYSALLRPDGHPGAYRIQSPIEPRNDCLHWCLPGPIDMWNQLLLQTIRPHFHASV